MKDLDTFVFQANKADSRDPWIEALNHDKEATAYEYNLDDAYVSSYQISGQGDSAASLLLPAVQAYMTPSSSETDARYPNNDAALDLIDWAFAQIA